VGGLARPAMTEILVNGFTRLTLEGLRLGEMQIANPRGVYPIADADRMRPEIEIGVRPLRDGALFDEIYDSPETGYLARRGRFYYRNCNVANDMDRPDAFYRGRLPNSRLRIRVETFEPLTIAAEATPNFVRESRSRLSRIASLDEIVSNLALIAMIHRGYVPMHAAAIELGEGDHRRSVLFMGLPNTGKTSTSLAACNGLAGRYLAEDISFVRPDGLAVFGGPYTLDEQKLQDQAALRAAQFAGAPLATLVMLRRCPGSAHATRLATGDPAIGAFIAAMNRYEFEWNHDLILRHLLLGGEASGFSSVELQRRYLDGMARIGAAIHAVDLSGEDPRGWPRLATQSLAGPA
jgi:hypothetical protein